MATTNLDRQVGQRLASLDIRYTTGRSRVVSSLASLDGPKSAAELKDFIAPPVPLSSLYRTLAVLEESGVVTPHYGKSGVARYELAEWLKGHHHHLVCIDCGAIEDVSLSTSQESRVHDVINDIVALAEFQATDHTLEIEGRCKKCS